MFWTGGLGRPMKELLWVACLVMGLVLGRRAADGFEGWNAPEVPAEVRGGGDTNGALVVRLDLIQSAAAKGAVCLDGTLPGYHLHQGYGSGANNWLVQFEGGGWCSNVRMCVARKGTHHGSSNYMDKLIPFRGILSNKREENPDFYNWNRVRLQYCDGASFSGEGYDEVHGLFFRGQRIWLAAMDELMLKGMQYAEQALLSGCSAGGLSAILHCDEFRALFPGSTKVKCLSDAGLFLDVADVTGKHVLRSIFDGVVTLQGVAKNLPLSCSSVMDPTLCFFPQNLINRIQTPIFLLNSAYDQWQLMVSLVPPTADPVGDWNSCKRNYTTCRAEQIAVLQGFRNQMVSAVELFSASGQNGLFINSCFAHCQSENQTTWLANDSPVLRNKRIAQAVGDWFFDRSAFRVVDDCPYPCDKSCLHQSWANNCRPLFFLCLFIIISTMVLVHDRIFVWRFNISV